MERKGEGGRKGRAEGGGKRQRRGGAKAREGGRENGRSGQGAGEKPPVTIASGSKQT